MEENLWSCAKGRLEKEKQDDAQREHVTQITKFSYFYDTSHFSVSSQSEKNSDRQRSPIYHSYVMYILLHSSSFFLRLSRDLIDEAVTNGLSCACESHTQDSKRNVRTRGSRRPPKKRSYDESAFQATEHQRCFKYDDLTTNVCDTRIRNPYMHLQLDLRHHTTFRNYLNCLFELKDIRRNFLISFPNQIYLLITVNHQSARQFQKQYLHTNINFVWAIAQCRFLLQKERYFWPRAEKIENELGIHSRFNCPLYRRFKSTLQQAELWLGQSTIEQCPHESSKFTFKTRQTTHNKSILLSRWLGKIKMTRWRRRRRRHHLGSGVP